jgi:hypothetical protein
MTAKTSTRWRAPLFFLALVTAVLIAAGCGSRHVSIDQENAHQIAAAWLGESQGHPNVSCRRHVCEIGIRYSFVDASEAWLIAVPITTYYRGPDYPGVDRIVLRITDARRRQVATFHCLLPKAPSDRKNWSKVTTVRDAHKMCKGSAAPADG